MTQYHFRKANVSEIAIIWEILQQAIIRRKNDGSSQWQDGYPNLVVVQKDIDQEVGYVLTEGTTIIGYSAVILNDEPAYENIEGKWLSNNDFVVLHRVAISEKYLGKGFAKLIFKNVENFALENNIFSVKVDTNFDNIAMIKILDNLGYSFCGEVYFRGYSRKAYEKILVKTF